METYQVVIVCAVVGLGIGPVGWRIGPNPDPQPPVPLEGWDVALRAIGAILAGLLVHYFLGLTNTMTSIDLLVVMLGALAGGRFFQEIAAWFRPRERI